MIEVRVGENHIQVSGHAGHAPPGQDIVCAGGLIYIMGIFQRNHVLWQIPFLSAYV